MEIPGAQSVAAVNGSYAPNGDFIFADTSWSIRAVDRTGSSRILAARESGDAAPFLVVPVASPSGTFITFSDVANLIPVQSWMQRPGGSEPEILLNGALIYSITSSGHALFIRGNVFQPQQTVAIPIDLESGAVLGEEVALGVRSYAVSPSGLLVFEDLSGQDLNQRSELYRVTSSGAAELLFTLPGESSTNFAISGDGSMLLVSASETSGTDTDMYRVNVSNGVATRLTRDGYYDESTWGAGNEFVYFDYNAPDSSNTDWVIMRRRADGSGTNEPVLPGNQEGSDPDFTPDGSILVYRDFRANDIWGYDTVADSIFPIVVDDLMQVKPTVSPDGNYVAYAQAGDDQCGSIQVSAVRSASEPIEIASNGCLPVWSADGAFVYYQDQRSVSRIPVSTAPVFEILGVPQVIYTFTAGMVRPVDIPGSLHYDVSDDGTLYIAHVPRSTTVSQKIWVVNNWFEELNRLVPRSE